MNPHLKHLHPYPFERLNQLKAGAVPPAHLKHIPLSIGEPKHPSPEFVKQVMSNSIDKLAQYPTTKGALNCGRLSLAGWRNALIWAPTA